MGVVTTTTSTGRSYIWVKFCKIDFVALLIENWIKHAIFSWIWRQFLLHHLPDNEFLMKINDFYTRFKQGVNITHSQFYSDFDIFCSICTWNLIPYFPLMRFGEIKKTWSIIEIRTTNFRVGQKPPTLKMWQNCHFVTIQTLQRWKLFKLKALSITKPPIYKWNCSNPKYTPKYKIAKRKIPKNQKIDQIWVLQFLWRRPRTGIYENWQFQNLQTNISVTWWITNETELPLKNKLLAFLPRTFFSGFSWYPIAWTENNRKIISECFGIGAVELSQEDIIIIERSSVHKKIAEQTLKCRNRIE